MKVSQEIGSSPIELIAWSVLLLMPLGFGLNLYGALSDQLAAESIARHGLRAAVFGFQNGSGLQEALGAAIEPLEASWGRSVDSARIWCSGACLAGKFVNLEVKIGNQSAIQSAGLAEQ